MAKRLKKQEREKGIWIAFVFAVVFSALISGVASGVSVFVWQNNAQQIETVGAQLDLVSCEARLEDAALRMEMIKTELDICTASDDI